MVGKTDRLFQEADDERNDVRVISLDRVCDVTIGPTLALSSGERENGRSIRR